MNRMGASCMRGKKGVIFCICGRSGPFDHAAIARAALRKGNGIQRRWKVLDDSRNHNGRGRWLSWESVDSEGERSCIGELEALEGSGAWSLSISSSGDSSRELTFSISRPLEGDIDSQEIPSIVRKLLRWGLILQSDGLVQAVAHKRFKRLRQCLKYTQIWTRKRCKEILMMRTGSTE